MSDTSRCRSIRRNLIKSIHEAGSGHYGASLSCVEILFTLYAHVMGPRDKLILSKGHAAPALYATLAEVGLIDADELETLRQPDSRLQGHPDRTALPHVHAGTGALGQGLSMAIGYALAAKLDGSDGKVYCIVGDGELQEGQIWEAIMYAAHNLVDNLVCIVDKNGFQNEVSIEDTLGLGDINYRFSEFGWEVNLADGHSVDDLREKLTGVSFEDEHLPYVIVADTVKGKGVKFMEGDNVWHSKQMTDEEYQKAMGELK